MRKEKETVGEVLERVESWIKVADPKKGQSESALQNQLLYDMFLRALSWPSHLATREVRSESGVADIILLVNKSLKFKSVVVELKRPNVNLSLGEFKAIKQAARYSNDRKSTYCIVTNGKDWWFLDLKPTRQGAKRKKNVRILMRINLVGGDKAIKRLALIQTLERCRQNTILPFFDTLGLIADLGKKGISRVTKKSTRDGYVDAIAKAIELQIKKRPKSGDLKPLQTLSKGDIGQFSECTVDNYVTLPIEN